MAFLLASDLKRSIKKDEWYTPKVIVDKVATYLNIEHFDLDAASNELNANRLNIKDYFDINTNGLENDWHGNVWLNPPFSLKEKFVDKIHEQLKTGGVKQVALLLPFTSATRMFQNKILNKCHVLFFNRRIEFIDSSTNNFNNGTNFESVVMIFKNGMKDQWYKSYDIINVENYKEEEKKLWIK